MDPAARVADRLRHHVHERGDVVLSDPLALLYHLEIEGGLAPDLVEVLFGYDPALGQYLANRELDLEPCLELALLRPDPAKLGARVTGDHARGLRTTVLTTETTSSPGCGRPARRRCARR